jgi:uncharacterized damage-inducible protein DinB
MDELGTLRKLFAYEDWANREALASLQAPGVPARTVERFAHLLGARRIWLARLDGRTDPGTPWPSLDLKTCALELAELERGWRAYLSALTAQRLAQTIEYVNTKGQRFSNGVGDVLQHLVLHSAYHRGQIASDVRAAGLTPANTDYIHAVRSGALAQR